MNALSAEGGQRVNIGRRYMFELKGKYNGCKVFTDNCDNACISQLVELLNQESVSGSRIRIMPDCHAGAGCVIGSTMTLTDKVIPNLVGVDIGCGMLTLKLKEKTLDLDRLDRCIRQNVPNGFDIHEEVCAASHVYQMYCAKRANNNSVDIVKAFRSLGSLGGGNHFIEVDKDEDGNLYLVIHTGSRHLGLEVCDFYQKLAYENVKAKMAGWNYAERSQELIKELKSLGRQKEISGALKKLKDEYNDIRISVPKELAYVEGEDFQAYIHDMKLTQEHASINRRTIADIIINNMGLHVEDSFETIHNYIDVEHMTLRKGAISAKKGERVLIPMNMRDGSLICIGKGNEDWNESAPHGAGRIMSRAQAKETVTLDDYKKSMEGIFTTCVNTGTIDESPMAYKPMQEIMENIRDTVDIEKIIKPIYNFKASE